jgi:hypothetical protein
MDPAASKEAVMHHAIDKERKNDCQDDYEQELSNPERGWLFSFRVRRIRISCHQISLSARSGASHAPPFISSIFGSPFKLYRFGSFPSAQVGEGSCPMGSFVPAIRDAVTAPRSAPRNFRSHTEGLLV